jgi:phosphatidylethanolamine N-methyltransferase
MNLALLISQVVLFLLLPRPFSRRFFFFSFVFWRAAYNAGLGWILTKQSKRKWIVREVSQRGWLDGSKRPEVREWIRKQLSVKMGRDYDFDVSSYFSLGGLVWTWLRGRRVGAHPPRVGHDAPS